MAGGQAAEQFMVCRRQRETSAGAALHQRGRPALRLAICTANYVAKEVEYRLSPFNWGVADRATTEAFHGPRFAGKFRELLETVRSLELDAIDLWKAHLDPQVATDDMVGKAVDLLREYGIRVVSYSPSMHNVTEAQARRAFEVARAIGVPQFGGGFDPRLGGMVDGLAREYGIRVGIENHPEKSPQEIIQKIGPYAATIGACCDTGWWGTQGYPAARAVRELGDHLFHVHLKDVKEAGTHHTVPYGDGVVDIAGCVTALQEIGYAGYVAVEHEPEDHDPTEETRRSLRILRDLLG